MCPICEASLKALSHHGVWPERMPTYTTNSSKIVRVQERPTSNELHRKVDIGVEMDVSIAYP